MLQRIRNNVQGLMAKIIIAIIIVPFALFGVDALFQQSGAPEVATVNGLAITEPELNQAIVRQRQALLQRMGQNADFSQLDDDVLREPVLESLINQKLLQSAAETNKIVVTDAMVDQAIRQRPEFQEEGRFSPELFTNLLRNNGWTPLQFKQLLRSEIESTFLLSAYVSTEFVTNADMALAAEINGQKRDFEFAVLTREQGKQFVSVGEDEVKSYFEANPEEFMTKRSLSVDYIELKVEDFKPEISEEDIRAAYDSSLAQSSEASQRRAAHLLLASSSERSEAETVALIEEIQQRLAQGEDFTALVTEYSEDIVSKTMGGDLGYTDGSAFPDEFEQALAELEIDQVSEPVETDAGWHFIKLTELEAVEAVPFEQARDGILAQLQEEKAEPAFALKLEQLKDLSFNAPDLDTVAEDLSLVVQNSGFFGSTGASTGLFADNRLVAQAFSDFVLDEGANSEVVELSPGHAIVLRVNTLREPEAIPYDAVRAGIEARLLAEKASDFINQRGSDILVAVEQGQLLSALAESENAQYKALEAQGRDPVEGVSPEIQSFAFELHPVEGETAAQVQTLANGDVAVVRVSKVQPGSLADLDAASQTNLALYLQRYRADRIMRAYQRSLRESAEIELM